jgi:hypothetical protein
MEWIRVISAVWLVSLACLGLLAWLLRGRIRRADDYLKSDATWTDWLKVLYVLADRKDRISRAA